jgi:hypothetical protein
MPLTVDRYTVLLKTEEYAEPFEREVAVIHGDRMRAELEGPKQGITSLEARPMAYMALWLWAACLREKVLDDVSFEDFQNMLLNFEEVPDALNFPGSPVVVDPLGPTTEEDSASLSSSPGSSATSPAGSTQTPTHA